MSLPLQSMRIMVTRPESQAEDLAQRLKDLGAEIIYLPAIQIDEPTDFEPLDDALENLENFDWVVLTSVNGVKAVWDRMAKLGIESAVMNARRLAAIGPATGEEVTRVFRKPDFVPTQFYSESLSAELPDVAGKRFLLPRADIARKHLADELTRRGAKVAEVTAYRIVKAAPSADLTGSSPDVIVLTSSSTVLGTLDSLKAQGKEDWMRSAKLACIGPITAATAVDCGFEVAIQATRFTMEGLVDAIVDEVAHV